MHKKKARSVVERNTSTMFALQEKNSTCHTWNKIDHWSEMCFSKGKFKDSMKQKNKFYAFKNNPNKVHALKVTDIRTVKESKTRESQHWKALGIQIKKRS